jgi:hypothetical protein
MAETTGVINGSDLRIFLSSTDDSEVLIDNLTDCSISVTTDLRDTTTKNNNGYRAMLPGLKSATINFTALYASDATNGYNELIGYQLADTKIFLLFTHAPDGTENAGDERFDVSGYITSLELSGGTEDNGTYTCTVEVHDTIVREAIPA